MTKVSKNSQNGQSELMELANTTKSFSELSKEVLDSQELQTLPTEKPRNEMGDIHYNYQEAKDRDFLNGKLKIQPPANWVKDHPIVKVKDRDGKMIPAKYLPISTVQNVLRGIFQRFKIEVIDYKVIANAITVHVRLHYVDPVSGEWDYQDGLGAVAIQLNAGSNATDFTQTKSDAIMKNLPSAESYAIKNAAHKLGAIFGGDLNFDSVDINPVYSKKETKWTKEQ